MGKVWIEDIKRAVYIAEKDIKIYFFKGPNLTFGLLLPAVLYLAFAVGRTAEPIFAIPGVVAMAALFGAGAIQSVSLPLERRTGTFNMILTAPISLHAIILGKTLAGLFFGTVLSLAYTAIMTPFTQPSNLCLFLVGIVFSSFVFSAFGLFLSAPFRDIPQAMPPATVVRIIMVFFCGVFTSVETLPIALRAVAYSFPLTYSVDALRQAMYGSINIQIFLIDLTVQFFYAIAFLVAAIKIVKRTIE